MQFPQKCEGKELKILAQPETQHRARYLTEGSRGSVKDRTQQGFPTVKVTLLLEHSCYNLSLSSLYRFGDCFRLVMPWMEYLVFFLFAHLLLFYLFKQKGVTFKQHLLLETITGVNAICNLCNWDCNKKEILNKMHSGKN